MLARAAHLSGGEAGDAGADDHHVQHTAVVGRRGGARRTRWRCLCGGHPERPTLPRALVPRRFKAGASGGEERRVAAARDRQAAARSLAVPRGRGERCARHGDRVLSRPGAAETFSALPELLTHKRY